MLCPRSLERGQPKMQCTSYVPVYYCVRNLNAGTNDFSWPIFNGDTSHKSGRSYNVSLPPSGVNQYLGYDKEVMRQRMLEHEATFRLQVQELHRLYKRQKELMGEIRDREFSTQQVLLQTSESYPYLCQVQSDTTHGVSHTPSWLFGNSSDSKLYSLTEDSFREPPHFVAEKSVKGGAGPSLTKNCSTELEILSSQSRRYRKKIFDLELPADMYDDDKEREQFEEGNINEAPDILYSTLKKFSDIELESDSKLDSVKPAYSSSSNLNCTKISCLIDLNEPVQLESLSSSSGPFVTDYGHKETVHRNHQDVNCDKGSSGINYSGLIDLNSTPLSLLEMTITLENTGNMEEETKFENSDGRAKSNAGIADKFSTSNTDMDLNSGVTGDEPSLAVPNRDGGNDVEIDLECSSQREKPENGNLETPSFLPDRDGEPLGEPDRIAAEILIMILSSEVQLHLKSASSEPLDNSNGCLYWFAGIVSSMGGEVLHEVEKHQKGATYYDQTDVSHDEIDDFEPMAFKLQHGHDNYFCQDIWKEKETVDTTLSSRPSRGRARGTRQCKDFQVEEDLQMDEGFLKTGSRRRNAVMKTSAKQRKYSNLRPSNRVKKSVSSILKQPDTCSKQGFLENLTGWGKMKKRQGGRARKIQSNVVGFMGE
ncbi:uncharacterized protein LOC111401592 [Olea europaea var. sylvestris]|uniref:uncharacterized protein LOC111401592 n=1 Tax=Olea europaea var. sylvestris TaxID=158386 RepID=UPI000C1CE57C|nr:uncharacterized protein LOC111401592 [Olea europaea var. sylvestris]